MEWQIIIKHPKLGWAEYALGSIPVADEQVDELKKIAASHFHQWWHDEDRQIIVGRKPSTPACWEKVAKEMEETVPVAKWLDWARRHPMEAREVLDLSSKDRNGRGREAPESMPVEPTWVPQCYGVDVALGKREYIVQANDDYKDELFGFRDDAEAASVHFAHWEIRTDSNHMHHVVARGPRSRTAKVMCNLADADRDHAGRKEAFEVLAKLGLVRPDENGLIKPDQKAKELVTNIQEVIKRLEA